MSMEIVSTPKLRPGKCVLTNDTQGPFLDTGKTIPRYGRIYISVKGLKTALRPLGFLAEDEGNELKEENQALADRIDYLEELKAEYDNLIETLVPHLPQPEPHEVVIKKEVTREPTDIEIAQWIRTHGANHPVIREAGKIEKGSTEEWDRLYRDKKGNLNPPSKTQEKPKETPEDKIEPKEEEEGPDKKVTLLDQEINLEELLKNNVSDITSFCVGKPEDFLARVVEYEWFLAEKNDRDPRKGVLLPLGYWEDDEPLYPSFDDNDDEINLEDLNE